MVFFKSAQVLALLAASPTEGIKMPKLRGGLTGIMSMHTYRNDCGHASGYSFVQNPGAGMSPGEIQPFKTVLKDGFYGVDCVKDYMFEHGDNFGDNKASYKLGDLTNVSIVHYANHVPKEDREEMTHEVCFRLCRTVPDMLFFGLTNGRECYCTPYYQAEASDSSECDEVCDGDKGTMCGGKTKSSIFGMHQCANTKANMDSAMSSMDELIVAMQARMDLLKLISETLQSTGSTYQDKFGQAGDPGASDLMQAAKVRAGKAEEMVRRGSKLVEVASGISAEAKAMAQSDFSSSEVTVKAEELMTDADKSSAELLAMSDEIQQAFAANLDLPEAEGAAKQYYSAMYFVDKEFETSPSTCSGAASEEPLVASLDNCARACDTDLHECVAFQFVPAAQGSGLCFLFSKLKTIRYYTGCSVQAQGATDVKCYAKVSKFEGTSIAPNPSGKCKGCLKEAKQADRCFT